MNNEPPDHAAHRRLAVDLFNEVWRLLEQPERRPEEDLTMIHAAHASRHHWGVAGDAKNWCIGEWQIARVYSTLGRAEAARVHARESLRLAEAHGLGPFLLACAHEGLARGAMVAGDAAAFDAHLAAAERAGARIEDEEDRQVWRADMDSLRRPAEETQSRKERQEGAKGREGSGSGSRQSSADPMQGQGITPASSHSSSAL